MLPGSVIGLVHGLNEPSAQTTDSVPLLIMLSVFEGVLLHLATNRGVHFPSDSAVPRAAPSNNTCPEGAGMGVGVRVGVGVGVLVGVGVGVLVGVGVVRTGGFNVAVNATPLTPQLFLALTVTVMGVVGNEDTAYVCVELVGVMGVVSREDVTI